MANLYFMGALGSAVHYALTTHLTTLTDVKDPQSHLDVLAIGFGGGVLGGIALNYWTSAPKWWSYGLFALLGVSVFDYFLFEM